MKKFIVYLATLPIITLSLASCNITRHTTLPPVPWTVSTDTSTVKPDVMPLFNGGDPKVEFPNWVYQNLRYPDEARKAKASGTATVQFTINTDGSLSDVVVVESPHWSISDEIVRVFSQSPAWTPAYAEGKPIRVSYAMPLIFRIPNPIKDTYQY